MSKSKTTHPIHEGLNPQQRTAVEHGDGPLLVIAGAGSGKTRVIIHRIAQLIRFGGVRPWNILALTFTNKAAEEMRHRAAQLIGGEAKEVTLCTFHSFCYGTLLRHAARVGLRPGFTVYDDADQKSLLKQCLKRLNVPDNNNFAPEKIHAVISNAKNYRLPPERYVNILSPLGRYITSISDAYEKALLENNAVDFDNLILKTLELFETCGDVLAKYHGRYTHILVDEYQDTNRVQFLLLRLLAGEARNVTAVGDQDQSIYRWRGADITNINSFEKNFRGAALAPLEQNYRSSQSILDAANSLIKKNQGYRGKRLWSDLGDGDPVFHFSASSERAEANFIADEIEALTREGFRHNDIVILFRTRAQTRVFEDVFSVRGVPYQIVGIVGFYQRKEIKDIIAYLKVLANPHDLISLARIINVPRRGIGGKALEKLVALLRAAGRSTADILDDPEAGALPPKVKQFLNLLDKLRRKKDAAPFINFLKTVISETGYKDFLKNLEEEEAEARLENVNELQSIVMEFERQGETVTLDSFLSHISLHSDVDSLKDETPTVKLMTLHCAKGLEFPAVFIAGVEEGLLPHYSALRDSEELEEERRLCYVGITRARKRLFFTSATQRLLFGRTSFNQPSRFLGDIGAAHIQTLLAPHTDNMEEGFLDDDADEPPARRGHAITAARTGDFHAGDMVLHTLWGAGRVVSLKEGEVCVAFDKGRGVKRFAVEYAPISKIEKA